MIKSARILARQLCDFKNAVRRSCHTCCIKLVCAQLNKGGCRKNTITVEIETRRVPGYRPMPILFNEDDHFDFDKPSNNMLQAIGTYASWGYFDPGKSDYSDGYQCPPLNWGINTERKRAFFYLVEEVTGS